MILDIDYIKNALSNEVLADIYLSYRLHGQTTREIAKRYGVHYSTIHDKYVRACHQLADELKRELARTEYNLGKYRTEGQSDWGNVPHRLFYVNGSTHPDTFTIPCIRTFVLAHCQGLVLNAFAGTTALERQGCQFVTNDLKAECPTNFHLDCTSENFVTELQAAGFSTFDTILLDPPFSLYLAKRKYNSEWFRDYTMVKNNMNRLAHVGTKIVSLGFNSTGMGRNRGYEKQELLIVNTKGNGNDILILVEQKVHVVPEETFKREVIPDGQIAN